MPKADPKTRACRACKKPLGQEPKVLPMQCSPADDASKVEDWCPSCFAYKRAPLEPGRWPHVMALHCGACSFESLHIGGIPKCGNCGAAGVVLLPPAPVLVSSSGQPLEP